MESTIRTKTTDSLLDEMGFFSELATLEDWMTAQPRTYTSPSETLGPIRIRPHGKFADNPEPSADVGADDGPSLLQQIAAAAMFVLMMAVGAAGAAVVFHERVARILANW
jgi:hypothetical protein